MMDYFAKWDEAYALPNHEAETVAEALVNNFITCFETLYYAYQSNYIDTIQFLKYN